MVFTSLQFLFFFLPITLGVYHAVPTRSRNVVLLCASLVFYTWGGGIFVLILLVSIGADYLLGGLAGRAYRDGNRRLKRVAVTGSAVINIGLLVYFKYSVFFVNQINEIAVDFGFPEVAWVNVALPIGISFYTFQSMSYTIDVSRGTAEPVSGILDFALYVALFPQLIAGPIVRYHELADQLHGRQSRFSDFAEGAVRFVHGLFKKVVIADAVGQVADAAFSAPSGTLTTVAAWVGILAFTLQIYFDFSGYTDMAIGLGRMFGFSFPENFHRPYSALSITDFWRRWHMTLSNWFRDYVYLPLGGSRVSPHRTYFNLVLVFLLVGLWHGANWTFVVWGIYHGGLMIVERVTGQRVTVPGKHAWVRRSMTFLLVMVGWVLFRADSLSGAWDYYGSMFSPLSTAFTPSIELALTNRNLLILALGGLVVLLPRTFRGGIHVARGSGRSADVSRVALFAVGLPYAALIVASGSFSPFLYFQF